MKKCLHIVTMSCKKRHHYARGWCLEVMDATRLEIVHVSSAANFATTPASKNQVILHPLGPGNGAGVIAPTGPQQWCRRYCTHLTLALVQALLQALWQAQVLALVDSNTQAVWQAQILALAHTTILALWQAQLLALVDLKTQAVWQA